MIASAVSKYIETWGMVTIGSEFFLAVATNIKHLMSIKKVLFRVNGCLFKSLLHSFCYGCLVEENMLLWWRVGGGGKMVKKIH